EDNEIGNDVVLGWILNSISEELFLGQIFSRRAFEAWEELKENFDRVNGSVTFNLHHKINSLTQNGSSIAEYFNKLSTLWKQFDALVQLPRLPSSVLKGKSPYQLVLDKKPPMKHLRVFGCLCFATILNNHDKFSSKAEKCVFLDTLLLKKVVYESPDTFNDDASLTAKSQSEGGNSPRSSRPTIDQNVNDLGHSLGSNGSACKDEMAATFDPNIAVSEDDHINIPITEFDFPETVYMDLPEGFFSPSDKRVCRLKKSLYGLKQAPRQWNAKLTHTLVENGFKQSRSDYSLFTKSENGNFMALLVYIDDIIVTGNNIDTIENIKIDTDKGVGLSQRKYCLDLLSEFGLLAYKPSVVLLEQNVSITNEPSDSDPLIDNITEYQKLIGKLIYLTHTRPDIAYSVHCLSQFMHKPLRSHLKIALKVLRYLKGSPGKGIHIARCNNSSLDVFVDADWAKCVVTRKSVTRFYLCLIRVMPRGGFVFGFVDLKVSVFIRVLVLLVWIV
nr:ribonuclease H-like domain-containing protein [Tanacetum cinerariifolium]